MKVEQYVISVVFIISMVKMEHIQKRDIAYGMRSHESQEMDVMISSVRIIREKIKLFDILPGVPMIPGLGGPGFFCYIGGGDLTN